MAIVEVNGVTLVRGETRILSGLSWTIECGEHWALLGANGSGKTMLLKVVAGYEWPTEGSVSVLGRRFGRCGLRELRKAIGWVSVAIEQRLPAGDTALEVVASGFDASMGLYREPTAAEWARAREALARMGEASITDRRFGICSQGEQQRVLIARALVHRPALIILDEPCAGLDPVAREAFLADLEGLAQADNAPTLVLVTHHIEEVGPWIDHVLAIRDGRPVAAGRTADVLTPDVLSTTFGQRCIVDQHGDRRVLRVAGDR